MAFWGRVPLLKSTTEKGCPYANLSTVTTCPFVRQTPICFLPASNHSSCSKRWIKSHVCLAPVLEEHVLQNGAGGLLDSMPDAFVPNMFRQHLGYLKPWLFIRATRSFTCSQPSQLGKLISEEGRYSKVATLLVNYTWAGAPSFQCLCVLSVFAFLGFDCLDSLSKNIPTSLGCLFPVQLHCHLLDPVHATAPIGAAQAGSRAPKGVATVQQWSPFGEMILFFPPVGFMGIELTTGNIVSFFPGTKTQMEGWSPSHGSF